MGARLLKPKLMLLAPPLAALLLGALAGFLLRPESVADGLVDAPRPIEDIGFLAARRIHEPYRHAGVNPR